MKRSSILTSASSKVSLSSRATLLSTFSRNDGVKRSKKMVVCRVTLLNGKTFEPKDLDKNADGQALFDKVCKELDIIETDYFGLTYREKNSKKFWLDSTKKIAKQVKGGTWVFEFQVKFYPPDPMSLKEDITRYQLCLQVRVDIFNGRLPCSFATYALLGSYTVQSMIGDYSLKDCGPGLGYLNDFDFAPNQNQELLEKIYELHESHKGQSAVVAEAHFLENAKKLAMYGVDMHDVKDSENKRLSLGICATGILVYRDRLRIDRFVWPKILKLSYKRNTFYIKLRPSEFDPHEKTVSFLIDNHKLAKRLWKICVEHHAFFRLKTADAPDNDTLFPRFNTRFRYSGRTAVQARKAAEMVDREEPPVERTAERRRSGRDGENDYDEKRYAPDESDRHGWNAGDPNATLERDARFAGLNSKVQRSPEEEKKLREDYMRLLQDTPSITSRSNYPESRGDIESDPRFLAVGDEGLRKKWFEEYVEDLKRQDFMQLLQDTPWVHSQSSWPDAREDLKSDPRFLAVGDDALREKWFNEFKQNMKKNKAEDKQRKKADDKRQKDKEAERKRLEKERKVGKGVVDPEVEEQKEKVTTPEKEKRSSGIFSMFGRRSGRDKAHEPKPHKAYEDADDPELKLKEEFWQLLRETPDITSTSQLDDVRIIMAKDPRYINVPTEQKRQQWFDEYIQNLMKDDFMRLLRDTPTIHSQSTWPEARMEIDRDPRFEAVGDEKLREQWFDEYIEGLGSINFDAYIIKTKESKLKSDYMQLLRDTPAIDSQSRFEEVRDYIAHDDRYRAVPTDELRKAWFNEYVENLKKADFMKLLEDTPSITSYSRYPDAKEDISHDPRFHNVDTDEQREKYFNEYTTELKKAAFIQLLQDTPDISATSTWHQSKKYIETDPRYHAVDSDLQRMKWFHEYVNFLAGRGYGMNYSLRAGGFKSIDRKQEFLPLHKPEAVKKTDPMPFFQDAKRKPPVASRPKKPNGYGSNEDLINNVPITVATESFKYNPDLNDVPRSTSIIPIVETKTHKVTYERDGVPYETEESILISAHSVTTRSQTIDTTTYKTERDGMVETHVERKITVVTDGDDDTDHDALLRAAIEQVTEMNPDLTVDKIECIRQIEDLNER
ncbi:protein 4.1-like isoform X5 [Dreissena polymorpha]|uniref:protein 4.1-like isoform X5 n=1 Tax=Dreissena polymorpha TaxID=45954 RepID=UPI0022651EB9|nr:protein 4.1-like isoform X5 [Dreissena polymorpha]